MPAGRLVLLLILVGACGRGGDSPPRAHDGSLAHDASVAPRPSPADAASAAAPRAIDVAVVAGAVVALLDDGTVRAWGRGKYGALGVGEAPDAVTPLRVAGITDAVELAAGDGGWTPIACVRDRANRWTCWGDAENLPGTATGPIAPTLIPELDQATAVRFGAWWGCALRADRTVFCWGHPPVRPASQNDPRQPGATVAGLEDVIDLQLVSRRACALRGDGRVLCWGEDDQGQTSATLGPPVDERWVATPTPVPNVALATEIGLGYTVSCARRDGAVLACWGQTFQGMGVVGVVGLADARFVETGGLELCERSPLGSTRCMPSSAHRDCLTFGLSLAPDCPGGRLQDCPEAIRQIERCARGELGFDPGEIPWTVLQPSPVRARAADLNTTCVVTDAGEVACWGKNDHGQLGVGTLIDHDEPRAVPALVETVPPPATPPAPQIDPAARAPDWSARPADCPMSDALELVHPVIPGPMPVLAAWADPSEYGTNIVLVDHLVADTDMSTPDLRADQRAVSIQLTMQAKGDAEFRLATPGRYPLRPYEPKRAGRFAEGSMRSSEVFDYFLDDEARMRGEVTITRHDDRWVCGTIDVRGRGRAVKGRFAAQVVDFRMR